MRKTERSAYGEKKSEFSMSPFYTFSRILLYHYHYYGIIKRDFSIILGMDLKEFSTNQSEFFTFFYVFFTLVLFSSSILSKKVISWC
jgi:hypothetical protein